MIKRIIGIFSVVCLVTLGVLITPSGEPVPVINESATELSIASISITIFDEYVSEPPQERSKITLDDSFEDRGKPNNNPWL